eukprot:1545273-Prymnesium_polylepis.1
MRSWSHGTRSSAIWATHHATARTAQRAPHHKAVRAGAVAVGGLRLSCASRSSRRASDGRTAAKSQSR